MMDLLLLSTRSSRLLCILNENFRMLIRPSCHYFGRQRANNLLGFMQVDKQGYKTQVRNPFLPEKTKAIRSSVLEVIYGGKENIPTEVSWGQTSDGDAGNADDSYHRSGIFTDLKQRVFLRESKVYQMSSLEYIHRLQGDKQEINIQKADAFIDCLSKDGGNLSKEKLKEGLHHFCALSQEAREQRLKSPEINLLVNRMCEMMSGMSTDDFVRCLLIFYWWEIALQSDHNSLIEKECLQRMSTWDVDTLLLVSDWWICKSGATSWSFHEQMVVHLRRHWTGLSPHQTVQAFYLCGQFKRQAHILMEKLILQAERLVDNLSLTETATICNGFIKSAGRLPKNSLLPATISTALYQVTHLETDQDLYDIVTILRFLGRSYYYDKVLYNRVADLLLPHLPAIKALALPHIAAVYARAQLINMPLFDGILRLFDHSKANLKDYYLTLWSFGRLNFSSADFTCFTDKAVSRIAEEETWTQEAPFLFVKTLVALTYIGRYSRELLDKAFSQAYLRRYKGQCPPDVYKHLYCVDCSLAIEFPEYSGNRLPKSIAWQSTQGPQGSSMALTDEDQEYGQIIPLLSEVLGGRDYLLIHPILDHIRTPVDIEVHLDRSGSPVSLRGLTGVVEDSHTKLAVLIGPEGHYVRDTHALLGVHTMKRRQLKTAGYEIVEIPFFEWQSVKKLNKSGKRTYLMGKLFKR